MKNKKNIQTDVTSLKEKILIAGSEGNQKRAILLKKILERLLKLQKKKA